MISLFKIIYESDMQLLDSYGTLSFFLQGGNLFIVSAEFLSLRVRTDFSLGSVPGLADLEPFAPEVFSD